MDYEKVNTKQPEGDRIPLCDGDAESGIFENGIMAGDLDSLLEMFEEAETVLSSSVDCNALTQTDDSTDREGISGADTVVSQSSCHPNINECPVSEDSLNAVSKNVTSEEQGDRVFQTLLLERGTESDIFQSMQCVIDSAEEKNTDIGGTEDKSSNIETKNRDVYFDDDLLDLATVSNCAAESSAASDGAAFGPWSPLPQNDKDGTWTRTHAENSTAAVPGFSAGDTFFQKYDSETSTDEDYPLEDRYSDSSSSPTFDAPCHRVRGLATCRDGPRRQHGRGRVKSAEEEKLYDRLPSYYTVLSRPNRTPTGLIRSSRSCLKLILNSDLPGRDRDPSPDSKGEIFDKVPAYQSCFTNSTRYDEESEMCVKFESGGAYLDNKSPRSGRGHGSGSSYAHSRQRFRSRSRLRSLTSSRHRRAGRAGNEDDISSSDTTTENMDAAEMRFSEQSKQSLAADSQNPEMELNQNRQIEQRRIVYIGGIPSTLTAERLKEIFEQFGQIEKCTAHFRECGDNYGFVTYVQSSDACKAVEGGCRLHGCEHFDICFGGRRNFCRADYFDHDGNVEMEEELAPVIPRSKASQDFDKLLMDALLRRRVQ